MSDGSNFRNLILQDLFAVETFKESMGIWSPVLSKLTNGFSDPGKVLDLGSHLREIFQATRGEGRAGEGNQSAVAKAGVAWECLVVWYLNLVFHGARGVAMRKKAHLVPEPVMDAISVTYGNFQTNSESDVIVIAAPSTVAGQNWSKAIGPDDDFFRSNIHRLSVGIVQCKSNWNENAQIPMLWDMIYRFAGDHGDLSVGKNGFTVDDFKKFTYSFVTAPTQTDKKLPSSIGMPTKRVRNLSGGNFWGLPSKNDVALSFKEIFKRNFSAAFDSNVTQSIGNSLSTNSFIPD